MTRRASRYVSGVVHRSDQASDPFLLAKLDFHRALGGFMVGCAGRLGGRGRDLDLRYI